MSEDIRGEQGRYGTGPHADPGLGTTRPPRGSSVSGPTGSSAVDPAPTQVIPEVPASSAVDPSPTQFIPRVGGPSSGDDGIADILRTKPTVEKRRSPRRKGRTARRVLGVLAGLLVVALVGVGFLVNRWNGNIKSLPGLSGLHPTDPSTIDPGTGLPPTNILLMGSDTRAGLGTDRYGNPTQVQGARSDVQMIAHLSADRKFVTVVSIPRDTMVKGPTDCNFEKPKTEWSSYQFNEYFSTGGYQCTAKIVESMTGLYIDDVAIVDFNGFKDMVNALGTVEVCLTRPVKDKESGADFPAGRQRLDGEQALSFVRVRHNIGDGSDIGRIARQQDFLSSMVREATGSGVLLNPTKLVPFIDAATKSLSTTPNLDDVPSLTKLASSLRSVQPANVSFVSMPWTPDPKHPGRVLPSPAAAEVWRTLREDKAWPGTPAAKEEAAASPSPTPSSTSPSSLPGGGVPPSSVALDIINAAGVDGLGKQAGDALEAQGFVVRTVSTSRQTRDGVVIHHAPADTKKAQELAAAFDEATLKPDGIPGQALRLELGLGSSKVKLAPDAPSGATLPDQGKTIPPRKRGVVPAKTADEDLCSETGG